MSFADARLQVAREKDLFFEQGKTDYLLSLYSPAAYEVYSLNRHHPKSFAGIHWQKGFDFQRQKGVSNV